MRKKDFLEKKDYYDKLQPESIKFNFDRSCNLKCPSCRLDFINYDGDNYGVYLTDRNVIVISVEEFSETGEVSLG